MKKNLVQVVISVKCAHFRLQKKRFKIAITIALIHWLLI